jgi:hypothetical protein
MTFSAVNTGENRALDLRIVKLCCQYATLHYLKNNRVMLSRNDSEKMHALERFLAGDSKNDRRSHQRMPIKLPVTLSKGESLGEGVMLNISPKGMFVLTDMRADLEEDISVYLPLTLNNQYSFNCRVIRKLKNPSQLGLGMSYLIPPVMLKEN